MRLKKVISRYFPFSGYIAMTFYPWIFIRKELEHKYNERIDRHESTHGLQQIETLWILFIVIYCLEFVVKLPLCDFNIIKAYKSISFEQEAYEHEEETYYNEVRHLYAWVKYIFKIKH